VRERKKRIEVYVTPNQHQEIKIFCASIGLSMSNFIEHAVRNEIKKRLLNKRE